MFTAFRVKTIPFFALLSVVALTGRGAVGTSAAEGAAAPAPAAPATVSTMTAA